MLDFSVSVEDSGNALCGLEPSLLNSNNWEHGELLPEQLEEEAKSRTDVNHKRAHIDAHLKAFFSEYAVDRKIAYGI